MGKLAELTTPPGWQQAESGLLVPQTCDMNIMMGVVALMSGGGAGGGGDQTLLGLITAAGLTTDLFLCLDAGDADCTNGTNQTFSDVSGAGNHFYRGANNTATTDDPTFNGTAGNITATWDFDGGDIMRLVAASNPTAIENLHKNNANFTILCGMKLGATTTQAVMGTRGGGFVPGFELRIGDSGATMRLGIDTGAGSFNALDKTGGSTFGTAAFTIWGVSINEAAGAGGGFLYKDGNYNQVSAANTFDATYASPSSSAAGYKMEIGAAGNGAQKVPNGTRIGFVAMWSRALSKANLDTLFGATSDIGLRARYGL